MFNVSKETLQYHGLPEWLHDTKLIRRVTLAELAFAVAASMPKDGAAVTVNRVRHDDPGTPEARDAVLQASPLGIALAKHIGRRRAAAIYGVSAGGKLAQAGATKLADDYSAAWGVDGEATDVATRSRSGGVTTHDQLVSFLYELMRDHVPPGVVEAVARNSAPDLTTFTNGWLAGYAFDLAQRLQPPFACDSLDKAQAAVGDWARRCFGEAIAMNVSERAMRVVEETIELSQAVGLSRAECHKLVDYVFDREPGDPAQEIAGVQVTLLALAKACGFSTSIAFLRELKRINNPETIEKSRRKQAAKTAAGVGVADGLPTSETT